MASKWIPNFIKRSINYRPKDILTAQEYNAILNLLITQGDYNSSWLEYLQNDAIPEAIADISVEQIQEALSVAVRQELDALAHEVNNKTSEQLNNPAITILNVGTQIAPWADFTALLDDKDLKATYSIATNYVGYSAYPTLSQLNTLKAAGNDIVAYSVDGSALTPETAEAAAEAAHTYMVNNSFNSNVFVYPLGTNSNPVINTVHNTFMYAVNMMHTGLITPDGITAVSPASVLGNLAVVKCDSAIDTATIKGYIDSVVATNKYMILLVDTDSASYSSAQLKEVLDYMLTQSAIKYPISITNEMATIFNTIGNRINILNNKIELIDGITITEVEGVKYINW